METKISGVTVTSSKKRESLLNRATESKISGTPAKPVSVSVFNWYICRLIVVIFYGIFYLFLPSLGQA